MEIKLAAPHKCTSEEIESFYKLVLQGSQVPEHGLIERIKSCHLLGFAYEGEELIAVTGAKKPLADYRDRVFAKAGVLQMSQNFRFEIGYAFTAELYRGRGIHQQLVATLIDSIETPSFYATTKAANVPYILEKIGFKKTGHDYMNEAKETLQLFTYLRRPSRN